MLHRSVDENGRERMIMVERAPIPALGDLKFAPGKRSRHRAAPRQQIQIKPV